MMEFAKMIVIRMALSTVFVAKLKKLDVTVNRPIFFVNVDIGKGLAGIEWVGYAF